MAVVAIKGKVIPLMEKLNTMYKVERNLIAWNFQVSYE
jgi:hypothetical protein